MAIPKKPAAEQGVDFQPFPFVSVPSQRTPGFLQGLPPFWGMPRQGESCAGIRRPPDTAAVHLDPTVGNPSMKAEAARLCYGPQAYGVMTVANSSFLMLGICYQSCTLQLKSQMT